MPVDHVEVLVEEASMEAVLRILLPTILGNEVSFQIRPSNGKQDLLDKLPDRLRGYCAWLPPTHKIVVVVDRDDEECTLLKQRLENTALGAGLTTKSSAGEGQWQVVNRLAIEELEAWFFGDMDAVRTAYLRVPKTLERRAGYRDPDAIRGGTWEAFERVLKRAGYFSSGYRKIEAARLIAAHMDPFQNQSRSFALFRDTIVSLRNDA